MRRVDRTVGVDDGRNSAEAGRTPPSPLYRFNNYGASLVINGVFRPKRGRCTLPERHRASTAPNAF